MNARVKVIPDLSAYDKARGYCHLLVSPPKKMVTVGPFESLIVTIKDAFETVGVRTTCGALHLKDYIPTDNTVAVQHYLDAGTIVFGKTSVSLFCTDSQTYNDIFGITNNPWNPDRSPGGSSGGAAAVFASWFTGIEK